MTPSLDGHVRTLMRPYINRSFFHSTFKVIQLNILFHILTGYELGLTPTLLQHDLFIIHYDYYHLLTFYAHRN